MVQKCPSATCLRLNADHAPHLLTCSVHCSVHVKKEERKEKEGAHLLVVGVGVDRCTAWFACHLGHGNKDLSFTKIKIVYARYFYGKQLSFGNNFY